MVQRVESLKYAKKEIRFERVFVKIMKIFGVFAKVCSQEFRKSVWSWSEIFIIYKKNSMGVV